MAKKIHFYLLLLIMTGCNIPQNPKSDEALVPGIPKEIPTLSDSVKPAIDSFATRVNIEYYNDTVNVSPLPQGVQMSVQGANVMLLSSAKGVEYRITGRADNGSFVLSSSEQVLISLTSLTLSSHKRNALAVASPRGIFLRGVGHGINYIMDGVEGDSVYAPKNSVAIRLDGDAVFCGGGNGRHLPCRHADVRGEKARAAVGQLDLLDLGVTLVRDVLRADDLDHARCTRNLRVKSAILLIGDRVQLFPQLGKRFVRCGTARLRSRANRNGTAKDEGDCQNECQKAMEHLLFVHVFLLFCCDPQHWYLLCAMRACVRATHEKQ